MMNKLIGRFIPHKNSPREEMEEAKQNITIGLSKIIKKNSGREEQNPCMSRFLLVLSSFTPSSFLRSSQGKSFIRVVALEEGFPKMDAGKRRAAYPSEEV